MKRVRLGSRDRARAANALNFADSFVTGHVADVDSIRKAEC